MDKVIFNGALDVQDEDFGDFLMKFKKFQELYEYEYYGCTIYEETSENVTEE